MVELIARYLSFQKQVSIKDVGTFSVEELPARLDFPNRLLHAPEYINVHYQITTYCTGMVSGSFRRTTSNTFF